VLEYNTTATETVLHNKHSTAPSLVFLSPVSGIQVVPDLTQISQIILNLGTTDTFPFYKHGTADLVQFYNQRKLAVVAKLSQGEMSSITNLYLLAAHLQHTWEVSKRVSKDDWLEWYHRLPIELLKEAPIPAPRSCWIVAQQYDQLARDQFNASFVSCCTELEASQQNELMESVERAMVVPDPSDINQIILNLAEFMEHCDNKGPLSLDSTMLVEQARKCRAYADVLEYKASKFQIEPTVLILKALVSINIKLGLQEAVSRLLEGEYEGMYKKERLDSMTGPPDQEKVHHPEHSRMTQSVTVPAVDLAVSETLHSLLTRSGNVERNPGPGLGAAGPLKAPWDHGAAITCLAVGRTGSILSGGTDGVVKLWDDRGQPQVTLPRHESPVSALCFTSTSSCAVTGHEDGSVMFCNLATKSPTPISVMPQVCQPAPVCGLSTSTDMITISCAMGNQLVVWDTRSLNSRVATLSHPAVAAKMTSEGTVMAAADDMGRIVIWDLRGNKTLPVTLDNLSSPITALAVSSTSRLLLASGDRDGVVRLWDVAEMGELKVEELSCPVSSLVFCPLYRRLFARVEGELAGNLVRMEILGTAGSTQALEVKGWGGGSRVWDMAPQIKTGYIRIATCSKGSQVFKADNVRMEDFTFEATTTASSAETSTAAPDVGTSSPMGGFPRTGNVKPGDQQRDDEDEDEDENEEQLGQEEQHEGLMQDQGEEKKPSDEKKEKYSRKPGEKLQLEEGLKFVSKEEAIAFVRRFCQERKTDFVIKSNYRGSGGQLIFHCRHGMKRKSQCTGARKNQKTLKKNCPAFLRFYVRVSGETILKGLNVQHKNHAVSEDIYEQDSAKADTKAVEIIRQLIDGNCKISNMKKALKAKGIYLSSNQVRYQVKLILGAPMDEEKLTGFIQMVREEGGDVKIDRFPDNKIRVMSIITRKMRNGYVGANPTVIQIDSTFGFEESGYKLNAVLYRNPATGRGEIVQLSFMADETVHSYNFALSSFEYIQQNNPAVIIIDKVKQFCKNIFPLNET
jgi:hypothetical protein